MDGTILDSSHEVNCGIREGCRRRGAQSQIAGLLYKSLGNGARGTLCGTSQDALNQLQTDKILGTLDMIRMMDQTGHLEVKNLLYQIMWDDLVHLTHIKVQATVLTGMFFHPNVTVKGGAILEDQNNTLSEMTAM
jgi:hypothetical protein